MLHVENQIVKQNSDLQSFEHDLLCAKTHHMTETYFNIDKIKPSQTFKNAQSILVDIIGSNPIVTPDANFINVKRMRFSYESYVLAAFLVTFWLWRQNFVRKTRA
jgi:hypothetical protein